MDLQESTGTYTDLQGSTGVYKTHHITGSTSKQHPAMSNGNPVTPWKGVTHPSVPTFAARSTCLTINDIVLWCPTICIIVDPWNPEEGFSCYQCIGNMKWLFSFGQLTV